MEETRAERIRRLRKAARRTQEEIALGVGVTLRAYQMWERGNHIRAGNLQKLAAYLGTTSDYLDYGELNAAPLDEPDAQLARLEHRGAEVVVMLREICSRVNRLEQSTTELLRLNQEHREILARKPTAEDWLEIEEKLEAYDRALAAAQSESGDRRPATSPPRAQSTR